MRAPVVALSSVLVLGGCAAASSPYHSTLVIPGRYAIVVESHGDPMLLRGQAGRSVIVLRQLAFFIPDAKVFSAVPKDEQRYDAVIVLRDTMLSARMPVSYEIRRDGRVAASGMIQPIDTAPPAAFWNRDNIGELLEELETGLMEHRVAETV